MFNRTRRNALGMAPSHGRLGSRHVGPGMTPSRLERITELQRTRLLCADTRTASGMERGEGLRKQGTRHRAVKGWRGTVEPLPHSWARFLYGEGMVPRDNESSRLPRRAFVGVPIGMGALLRPARSGTPHPGLFKRSVVSGWHNRAASNSFVSSEVNRRGSLRATEVERSLRSGPLSSVQPLLRLRAERPTTRGTTS